MKQLSLKRLFATVTLLGLGLGFVIYWLKFDSYSDYGVFLPWPAFPLIGAGLFAPFKKTHLGVLLGTVIGIVLTLVSLPAVQ